jgi:hypothetical protein
MLIKDPSDLKACLKNGKECKQLCGYMTPEVWKKYMSGDYAPHVWCGWGWDCRAGCCRGYEAGEEK